MKSDSRVTPDVRISRSSGGFPAVNMWFVSVSSVMLSGSASVVFGKAERWSGLAGYEVLGEESWFSVVDEENGDLCSSFVGASGGVEGEGVGGVSCSSTRVSRRRDCMVCVM